MEQSTFDFADEPVQGPAKRIAHNFVDRTGDRFGRLVVVSLAERREGVVYWLCRCDCGKEKPVSSSSLKGGLTASCGCARRKPKDGRGPGVAARGIVLSTYKKNAQNRSLIWDLTEDEFDQLTSGDCHYCGCPPSRIKRSGQWDSGFTYNGIDRKDNSLGYVAGNVVSCCMICNNAKKDLSFDDFATWLARLTAHQWFNPDLMPSRLLKGGA